MFNTSQPIYFPISLWAPLSNHFCANKKKFHPKIMKTVCFHSPLEILINDSSSRNSLKFLPNIPQKYWINTRTLVLWINSIKAEAHKSSTANNGTVNLCKFVCKCHSYFTLLNVVPVIMCLWMFATRKKNKYGTVEKVGTRRSSFN